MMRRPTAMVIVLAVLLRLSVAAHADALEAEITYLLDTIRHSACVFIRNGSDYDGPAAAEHVQAKYEHFKREIRSAEDFIDRAATKSLLTGEPYRVRCNNDAPVPAAEWLRGQLGSYRAGATGKAD